MVQENLQQVYWNMLQIVKPKLNTNAYNIETRRWKTPNAEQEMLNIYLPLRILF